MLIYFKKFIRTLNNNNNNNNKQKKKNNNNNTHLSVCLSVLLNFKTRAFMLEKGQKVSENVMCYLFI